jgi:hypothetical protein
VGTDLDLGNGRRDAVDADLELTDTTHSLSDRELGWRKGNLLAGDFTAARVKDQHIKMGRGGVFSANPPDYVAVQMQRAIIGPLKP